MEFKLSSVIVIVSFIQIYARIGTLNIPTELRKAGYNCHGWWSDKRCGWFCGEIQYNPKYYACCHEQIYRKDKQICCEKHVYHKWMAGCCNGCVYAKRYQGCCNWQIYKFSEKLCCANRLRDKVNKNSVCCSGEVIDKVKQGCCNNKHAYNLRDDKCCGDTVYKMSSGTQCCGNSPYNPPGQKCCKDHVYNVTTQGCCDGHHVYNKDVEKCCGEQAYDPTKDFCCRTEQHEKDAIKILEEVHHYPSCEQDGFFENTCYCDKFFTCLNSDLSDRQCQPRTVFHAASQRCVLAVAGTLNATCGNRQLNQDCEAEYGQIQLQITYNQAQIYNIMETVPVGPVFTAIAYLAGFKGIQLKATYVGPTEPNGDFYEIECLNNYCTNNGTWHFTTDTGEPASFSADLVPTSGVGKYILNYVPT